MSARAHRRGRRQDAALTRILALLLCLLVLTGCVGHGTVGRTLDQLPLPDDLHLMHEEELGVRGCFLQCPWVERRYMTAATPQQVCERLEAVVEEWPDSPEFDPDPPATYVLCSAFTEQGTISIAVVVYDYERDSASRRSFTHWFDVPPELEDGTAVSVSGNVHRR